MPHLGLFLTDWGLLLFKIGMVRGQMGSGKWKSNLKWITFQKRRDDTLENVATRGFKPVHYCAGPKTG